MAVFFRGNASGCGEQWQPRSWCAPLATRKCTPITIDKHIIVSDEARRLVPAVSAVSPTEKQTKFARIDDEGRIIKSASWTPGDRLTRPSPSTGNEAIVHGKVD